MIIERAIEPHLLEIACHFAVVAILGPRQSGKTTVARKLFTHHTYLNLEDLSVRAYAREHPKEFLSQYLTGTGIIIDEFQHVPELLSYIQVLVDETFKQGAIILTGSYNFLMNQQITQSLAGRVAIATLLPLSIDELTQANKLAQEPEMLISTGFYPPLYARKVPAPLWYPSYIQTYLERDLRDITQVESLSLFKNFMQLCAGRIGQLLNINSLAMDCGITDMTAKRWLALLEASYIIFLLRPHHNNYNKRLTKSTKLYFFDTGIACSLLDIDKEQLIMHYMRGHLFENLVIADMYKHFYNIGKTPPLYFWRDHTGHEIDALIETRGSLYPIEIKASRTAQSSFFDGLKFWNTLSENDASHGFVVYAGNDDQLRSSGTLLTWKHLFNLYQRWQ